MSEVYERSWERFMPYGSYAVVTFGCQMNAHDSEKIAGILESIGYTPADDEINADIVVFNTCTVREKANQHLYGRLGRLKKGKKEHPDKIIAVCGCMMQEADEVALLRSKYPYVDIIFGTHNLFTFPDLLYELLSKRADRSVRKPIVSIWDESDRIVEDLPLKRKFPFKQGINIMYGCDNFCTYCIVPYVRGRERSRAPEEIYYEIRRAAHEGVKEIMLLGQNVNSYGGGIGFSELLKRTNEIACEEGIERIRFMTSHPKDLTDELIDVMAHSERICHQFHLPLQSGSDRILHLMNRRYSAEHFIERALALRSAMPDITLSTDIIVGFPGESDQDFEDTLSVLSDVRFDFAYTFIYSKREGTPAAKMPSAVDPDTVRERFSRLLKLQNTVTAENLSLLTGSSVRVLYENISEFDDSLVSGKTEGGVSVHTPGDQSLIGTFRDTRLSECRGFYFMGELLA